ncbi:unnamed protein product [Mytilus coruscus]|uniref:Uncharacterized protein n=1 Tax=Mytilus coruscus TaxID=42192 RepID=A0A6J8ATX4_MYTCO|nr:unnamed protein product [Mytilus coruscus]
MGLGDAALAIKLALIFVIVGFLLHIIGFGAPYWSSGIFGSVGLWQSCSKITDSCSSIDTDIKLGVGDWFTATRTFECFGLIGSIACLVFIGIFICVGRCSGSKCIAVFNVILLLGTGACILIAIIIYASESNNLAWAFGLATTGGVCFALAGIFMIVSMCQ